MKQLTITFFIIFSFSSLVAQETSLKEKAQNEFKSEHYDEAISLLEQALTASPNDAEIYYYLGFFNHYRAYDSRSLKGYDFTYSEKIFDYLNKAIELDPNYGDAKYFYGAECSANAFRSMQNYDLEKLKYFYQLAYDKGAYPDWLLEYDKNMLATCDKDALLFTGGNADLDVCTYLQLHQNYRTDITLIPIGFIDRPWYIKFLKQGLEGGVKKITLNLTDDQIYDIHPFKWKVTDISISLSTETLKKYKLDKKHQMQWTVEPDFTSNRMHSKVASEKAKKRTYLSPQRAILVQIIEENYLTRPIFFSNAANPFFFGGLDNYFTNCGLVSKLSPIKTKKTEFEFDYKRIEQLFNKNNIEDFQTLKNSDIPRISGIVFIYHRAILNLANHYNKVDKKKLKELKDLYYKYFAIEINANYV